MAICSTLKLSVHEAPTTIPLSLRTACANAENAPPDELCFTTLIFLCINAYADG